MAKYAVRRCNLSKGYFSHKSKIDNALKRVLKSGVYTLGREGELFEEEFAGYVGRRYGVGVASGTDALVIALKALGIKKGDGVITSAYGPTPIPTAIMLSGGIPVFADIEESTCLIDPVEIEKKISRKTQFIMPVHLFGAMCDMGRIKRIALKNNLLVVEDASQAHGSAYGGRKAGCFGELSCFSFYPTKNLGGYGDGGMILADSRKIRDKLRLLRNYGKKHNLFDSEWVGFNSRLDEVQASVLRVKLRHLDRMNKKRDAIVNFYKNGLKGLPVSFPKIYDNSSSNNHILAVLCGRKRDGLRDFLETNKIQTNIYYPKPFARMKAFRSFAGKNGTFPVSEKMTKEILALPLYPELKKEEAGFIIKKIKEYFLKHA